MSYKIAKRKVNFHLCAVRGFKGSFYMIISGLVVKLFFSIFSFAIAVSDLKTGRLPRIAFVFAFPVFFVLCLLTENSQSVVIMLVGALLGLVIFLLAFFVSGKRLGLADVWYASLIGLVLGPYWWYAAVFCACIAGIVYILVSGRRKIPFIPLMALGSVVASIFQIFSQ
jgi:prepilin signal peptidase PulO-like enzyme (type II secretory pathway)